MRVEQPSQNAGPQSRPGPLGVLLAEVHYQLGHAPQVHQLLAALMGRHRSDDRIEEQEHDSTLRAHQDRPELVPLRDPRRDVAFC
ncbi:MAG: hypothetical protein WKF47_12555 [Geodermatophilaceae bacterium]